MSVLAYDIDKEGQLVAFASTPKPVARARAPEKRVLVEQRVVETRASTPPAA